MPRKSTKLDLDEPTAVETEAVTDAVEAAVEDLAQQAIVACIGDACESFGRDKADREVCFDGPAGIEGFPETSTDRACIAIPKPKPVPCIGSNCQHYGVDVMGDGSERPLCSALPDEPPTELMLTAGGVREPCIATTLMQQTEVWEKLVEHDNGQLAVDVDTDEDVRDQVRERLFNDVLRAQEAVSKAVDKLGDARQAQRGAESFLEKYDAGRPA